MSSRILWVPALLRCAPRHSAAFQDFLNDRENIRIVFLTIALLALPIKCFKLVCGKSLQIILYRMHPLSPFVVMGVISP